MIVNDFWTCVLGNNTSDRVYWVIKEFLASFIGKTDCNTLHAPSWKWASTGRQQCLVMRPGKLHLWQSIFSHKGIFGCLYRQNRFQFPLYLIMKIRVNGASTMVGHVSWVICGATGCTLSWTDYWLPLLAKVKVKRFIPHLQNERQQTFNDCWPSIMVNHSAMWLLLSIYIVLTVIIL